MSKHAIPSVITEKVGDSAVQFVLKPVAYEFNGEALEGLLIYSQHITEPRPGLVVLPNWLGINEDSARKAIRVAGNRYVVFLADMYGKDVRPENADEAQVVSSKLRSDRPEMRGRALAAVSALRAQADAAAIDLNNLGAVGFCFGGSCALELARAGADLQGFVSFHGSLDTPHPIDAHNIKAPVLVLHGAEDPIVTKEQVDGFIAEMRLARVDWQLFIYGGAVHSFTSLKANVPGVGEYHPVAAARAFKAMNDFFDEAFAD
ncbi:dienelactone hydrolase family protein [Pseudomonas sp. 5P_3.1_Bac2]|uniref:dienelactone hydrolase family protein n=1 Tax=Pseudomonas sp. 5P_3.1_Bac2 TaxID=2971617 RepID=UPI0021C85C25|nr:dienelactone hydrolase family protein [Pseudomonas sp. 5P_3.1_Bac2]MCU1716934.1 dienelactone hydrolase family protein [Pseudomonas sp. 5P_3.1_Bac2]